VPKVNYLIVVILTYIVSMSGSIAASGFGRNADIEKLENIRRAFEQMQGFMMQRPDLFPARTSFQKELTTREQREEIWAFWQSFLDRLVMLDAIGERHNAAYEKNTGAEKAKSYHLPAR